MFLLWNCGKVLKFSLNPQVMFVRVKNKDDTRDTVLCIAAMLSSAVVSLVTAH